MFLTVVFYQEWLSPVFVTNGWMFSYMESISANNKQPTVKVLFVADPQILSTLTEPYYPLSAFAVWDANR